MKRCNCSRVKALEQKLEDVASALKIIISWAMFEYDSPRGKLKHVEQMARRALGKVKLRQPKPTKRMAKPRDADNPRTPNETNRPWTPCAKAIS